MKKTFCSTEALNLSFKGERNYITGADLYTEINNVISSSSDGFWVKSIKFRGFADSSCFIQFSDIDKVDDKCIRGDFSIVNSGGIVKGVLIEDGNEITERVDYDESLIEGHVDLSERCIRCTKKSIHNVIDEVVSLTKQLHNSLYPREEGKWIFLQLDLLSMLPVTFDTLSIQIEKVIKESFSVSSIIVNGQKIGSIRFTVVCQVIGIKNIAHYLPADYIDNKEQAVKFGESESFASDRLGCEMLPVKSDLQDTSDLAVCALNQLLDKEGLDKSEIDCLIVCTQNPDEQGLPHTSAIVQAKAGLSNNVAAFDISLGCSGYVYGLNVIKGFMSASGLQCGVLITSDPYSKIIDRDDRNTAMLFGDAATATLMTNEPVLSLGGALFSTNGNGGDNIQNLDGKFVMNGRQVFNFASKFVPLQIKKLSENEGLLLSDYDKVLLHQGSRHIVTTISRRLGLTEDVVPCSIGNTGNTVSSSIPLLLEEYLFESDVNNILLSGFGVGLSWASMVLKRKN